MISICIPIYNFDCRDLLYELSEQAENLHVPYEMLAIDDASDESFKQIHRDVSLPHYRYMELDKNIGRSKIRNLLIRESQYPYLIFMDCDVIVSTKDYLSVYLSCCHAEVVCCGGHVYQENRPEQPFLFHWKYGKIRESLSAVKRRERLDHAFYTSNFMVDKSLLEKLRFNESLAGYGYEDTLMGLELAAAGISIQHIDNPVVHIGLEDTDTYLSKVKNALRNLRYIESVFDKENVSSKPLSGIIRMKKKLQGLHLLHSFSFLYKIGESFLERNLKGKHPNLFLFDLYRLGYYCSL